MKDRSRNEQMNMRGGGKGEPGHCFPAESFGTPIAVTRTHEFRIVVYITSAVLSGRLTAGVEPLADLRDD